MIKTLKRDYTYAVQKCPFICSAIKLFLQSLTTGVYIVLIRHSYTTANSWVKTESTYSHRTCLTLYIYPITFTTLIQEFKVLMKLSWHWTHFHYIIFYSEDIEALLGFLKGDYGMFSESQ